MNNRTGGTLLPPTDLPPTDLGGEDDEDSFEAEVPRPVSVWGVYVPPSHPERSGFYAEGYLIPDLFPTKGDAESWVERSGQEAKVLELPGTKAQLEALSEREVAA